MLAFHGQHAFALGTVMANWPSRPDLGERWPSPLVATAAEGRLNIRRNATPCTHTAQIASGLRAYFAVTSPLVLSNWYFCFRLSNKIALTAIFDPSV
jgi:hypothetical protein